MIPEITTTIIIALLDGLPLAALVLLAAALVHLVGLLLGVKTRPGEVAATIWDALRCWVRRHASRAANHSTDSGRRSWM